MEDFVYVIGDALGAALTFFVFSVFNAFPVMLLWNLLMSYLFELPLIDFSEALGIVVLCRILFCNFEGYQTSKKIITINYKERLNKALFFYCKLEVL